MLSQVALFYIPESPNYLYTKGRYDESKVALNYIGKFNRNKIDRPNYAFVNENRKELSDHETSLSSLIKNKTHR
jgi:hypothetical protein